MNHKVIYILLSIFCLNWTFLNAQELTYITHDIGFNGDGDTLRIGHIELNTCDFSLTGFSDNTIYHSDITLDSDSILYFFQPSNPSPNANLGLWSIEFFPIIVGTLEEQFPESKEGVTCDKEGNIYLAGEALSRWNSNTGQISELGLFPPSMACQGDLTFRKGKLFLSSISHTLVEVNLDNPMNSSVVMNFPSGIGEIHGLATVNITCDSVETYAAASHPIEGSTIYRINFESMTLEEICHYDFFITGLATYDECIFPECSLTVDLDVDNSSGADQTSDFQRTNTCAFPVNITDSDIALYSETTDIDSIVISLTNPLSIEEFLSVPSNSNLDVFGNNTTQLVLLNNSNTQVSDFEQSLQTVLYHNEDTEPIYSERIIEITAHFGPFQSSIARSLIPIEAPDIEANFSTTMIDCFENENGAITTNITGGIAPYNLMWDTGQTETELSQLTTGVYYLTISDATACSIIDSVVISQPDSLVLEIFSIDLDTFCGVEGSLIAVVNGGTEPYNYTWSNEEIIAENFPLMPGEYSVSIQDANGCTTQSTYTLFPGSDITNTTNQTSCFGTEIIINGQVYTSDTSFCLTYTLANGCDSLECYHLDFYEESSVQFSESICIGDSIFIQDSYYSTDTLLSFAYIDMNGCDSFVVYELSMFEESIVEFEAFGSICEDEEILIEVNEFQNYEWSTGSDNNFIVVEQSGFYEVTVTDVNNCISTGGLEVMIIAPLELTGDTTFVIAPGSPLNISLQANANLTQIQWYPSDYLSCDTCLLTTITPSTAIEYSIIATDQNGCMDTAFVQIDLLEAAELFVPNVFTPNGDNVNDRLTVFANPNVIPRIQQITIISRNGHVVFQTENILPNDENLGWDGLFNGRKAQQGTYILYVTYENLNGEVKQEIHNLTLVR